MRRLWKPLLPNSRWRCNHHAKYVLNPEEDRNPIRFDCLQQTISKLNRPKQVRSNRLGLEYTVNIKRI
ncbi:hypothetical protein RIR_jg33340.t1 [Rhizophagus irregularis DAOM 181602=DAOM 197198]|nr:hypothetical protein RIR_jg33340.t1 [Rhizophagus irregularis DAOM 181602=DAOM 197198]